MVQASISEHGQHLLYGWVQYVEHKTWKNSQNEHRGDHWCDGQALGGREIYPGLVWLQRTGEDALDGREQENGGGEQAKRRQRCGPGAEGEGTLENQELAHEAVETRQAERREERNAHQSSEDGRDFAQSAEIVEAAG